MKSLFTAIRILIILLAVNLFVMPALSQPGSNDPTFNTTDQGFGFGDAANSTINTTAIQSDGKIIIGGAFTSYNKTVRNYIARLNTDGSLDAAFNPAPEQTIQSIQSPSKAMERSLLEVRLLLTMERHVTELPA